MVPTASIVIDRSTKTVYRINLKTGTATVVAKNGTKNKAGTVAQPRYLAVGGQDLLILDSKNILWRWRPADDKGRGNVDEGHPEGSASPGDDVLGINTFLRPGTRGLYNLYIVDPSKQQIRDYPPAANGSGFPAKSSPWLATARDVSQMTSTFVNSDVFVADGGQLERSSAERPRAGTRRSQGHRSPARARLLAGGVRTARREGEIYGFDKANERIIALSKVDGWFKGQYRLAEGKKDWTDLRAMYVVAGAFGRGASCRRPDRRQRPAGRPRARSPWPWEARRPPANRRRRAGSSPWEGTSSGPTRRGWSGTRS